MLDCTVNGELADPHVREYGLYARNQTTGTVVGPFALGNSLPRAQSWFTALPLEAKTITCTSEGAGAGFTARAASAFVSR